MTVRIVFTAANVTLILIVIYLATLKMTEFIQCQIISWLVNNEWEGMLKRLSCPNFSCQTGTFLRWMQEIAKIWRQPVAGLNFNSESLHIHMYIDTETYLRTHRHKTGSILKTTILFSVRASKCVMPSKSGDTFSAHHSTFSYVLSIT
jgi:hypothetical protein